MLTDAPARSQRVHEPEDGGEDRRERDHAEDADRRTAAARGGGDTEEQRSHDDSAESERAGEERTPRRRAPADANRRPRLERPVRELGDREQAPREEAGCGVESLADQGHRVGGANKGERRRHERGAADYEPACERSHAGDRHATGELGRVAGRDPGRQTEDRRSGDRERARG
jgi:hypothetical protein